MQVDTDYRNAYAGAGEMALLCEGDVLGYEAAALRKWCDAKADIWPCGTKTAVYGMSDAIGRARPILVVEDRDFRPSQQAQLDCDRCAKDRERRGVNVVAWRCWHRNEIENYLLHPDVCEPVLSDWFGCSTEDVVAALNEVLPALIPFQAAQFATSRFVAGQRQPQALHGMDLGSRPTWGDRSEHLVCADAEAVRDRIARNVKAWSETGDEAMNGAGPAHEFEALCTAWGDVGGSSDVWRLDWAGKEVLKYLRMLLAARFGWYDEQQKRPPVDWKQVGARAKPDALDRPIERRIGRELVPALIAWLRAEGQDDDRDEWLSITQDCRRALGA